jgi:anti-sigma regulatory factor (Ser/Thr protein kinase)
MLFSVPARPQSAAAARHRLSGTLRDWALPVDLDTAQLLLSEVVTNAIRHGTDPAARDAVITIELAETVLGCGSRCVIPIRDS